MTVADDVVDPDGTNNSESLCVCMNTRTFVSNQAHTWFLEIAFSMCVCVCVCLPPGYYKRISLCADLNIKK